MRVTDANRNVFMGARESAGREPLQATARSWPRLSDSDGLWIDTRRRKDRFREMSPNSG
jgi:hypothetical protein